MQSVREDAAGSNSAGTDRKFVVALARGLQILRAFRPNDGFLGNQEIAERTGLPKPTVSRLTHTLCELGYLARMPRIGKYQLAPTAITLGYAALVNLGIRTVARPRMRAAATRLGAPIAMGVLDHNRALYLDIAHGSATFTVQLDVGSQIPLAQTAMGWALIAATSPEAREPIFERLAIRHGDEWPELHRLIDNAIGEYEKSGFVSCERSWRDDIHAVGVPLVTADRSEIYAFNCGGPPHQFTSERMQAEYGPALREMVAGIEADLNGLP